MSTAESPMQVDTEALISYLDEASIRLAVFGEFSAGKTTVLNALIGEEILSVAVEPTTAVPTRVRYGREFNIFIDRVDGERLVLFEDDPPFWTRFVGRRDTLSTLRKQQGTIREFLQTWTKEGEQASEVERVVIELPLGWLKGGLELVDTPGVNNEFARHQGFTEQEAGAADIAVLLMDARQGGGKRTEFEFMNEVQAQVERCIVAPNKLDLIPEGEREEFLAYIRETALPKHWEGAVTPPVIGISALAALHPEEHEEPGLVKAFEELRERLEGMAEEERGKLLLARRGNPEKELFGRAKELEGEEHYGRAHRLYFDLLDVLEAAGLDPTPAEEGIARCEEHLSDQVEALDTLNERYNEAMALADEDPDAALERLESIRDEKEDLRLEDGDLHASIEQLQGRIEERDAARQEIQRVRAQVEQHRHNENWIKAAEKAQAIPPLIATAELTEEQATTLREFVATQEQDRDEWAEERWMEIKDRADACVEEQRYLDAEEHLDDLKAVAPYTPFEEETANFSDQVTAKARTEERYREAVKNAVEKSAILRQDRVDPETGKELREAIEAVTEPYRSLYGYPDLPDVPAIDDTVPSLTVNQKLGLARRLKMLSEHASQEQITDLLSGLQERKSAIDAVDAEDEATSIQTKLLEEYPDHPAVKNALQKLTEKNVWFWEPPWKINQIQEALDSYEQEIEPEKYGERRLQLQDTRARSTAFYGAAVILVLLVGSLFVTSVVNPYFKSRSQYQSLGEESRDDRVATAYDLYHNSISYGDDIRKWVQEQPLIPFSVLKKKGLTSRGIVNEVQRWNRERARRALKNRDWEAMRRHLSFAGMSPQDFAEARLPRLVETGKFQKALDLGSRVFEDPQHIVEVAARGCTQSDGCREFAREVRSFLGDNKNAGLDVAQELIDDLPKEAAMLAAEYSDTTSTRNKASHPFWSLAREEILEASEDGKVEVVEALLTAGLNTDVRREGPDPEVGRGLTPLMLAAGEGNVEVVQLLLRSGADPSKVRGEGGETALTAAAANNHTRTIHLLVESGADPNRSTGVMGSTPLKVAVRAGHPKSVEALLEAGSIPSTGGPDTPLKIACQKGYNKIVQDIRRRQKDKKNNRKTRSASMFRGGPKRTGVSGYIGSCGPVVLDWSFGTEGQVDSSPSIYRGKVYVGSYDENVYAIDKYNGKLEWRFYTRGEVVSSPAVANNTVYVGSRDENVYAIDANNGQKRWVFYTDGMVQSSPVVNKGTVYIGNGNNRVLAIDADSGYRKWEFETHDSVRSSPAVMHGIVYAGSRDGNVYALDSETGRKKWSFETGDDIISSPAIAEGKIFVGSTDGKLYALDSGSGAEEWVFSTEGGIGSSPAVSNGVVYFGSRDHNVYAVDAKSGEVIWIFETDSIVDSSPTVTSLNVYIGSFDNKVYSIGKKSGHKKWEYNTHGWVFSSPAVHKGSVYVGTNSGHIISLK